MIISLDAMGGDHGPDVVLAGADIALLRKPQLRFMIFGERDKVLPVLKKYPKLDAVSEFIHCDISIAMDDKPSKALRRGRWKSGMWKAVEAVKHGNASVCVSAGNTGALMVMSKFCLRTLPGIERPAMSAIWPTLKGESIVLDVGANIGATSSQLVEFAIMGSAMARALSNNEHPSVGLLNIGVEEVKGLENVRGAGQILRETKLDSMRYHGFVEGNDIGAGTVDVVVTEGFAGNIALKTAEGTAKQMARHLKDAMSRTLMAKIGYLFAKSAFEFLRAKLDPRNSNGAVLL
ncbi:MAG: phosphate acyltransferase PlsX, partial [Rhizobiaceae bacterium]|nr:phosphate acyltransferase PlsX [Rhizobiaceae bacterium]